MTWPHKGRNNERCASPSHPFARNPDLPIETKYIRQRFTEVATRFRQHHTRDAELVHTSLGIDITGRANWIDVRG